MAAPNTPAIRRCSVPCNYPHLSTPNQCLAGFVQIVSLCAELFEGPPRQATLSGSNIDRSRNYNGPCGWSEMWVIASPAGRIPAQTLDTAFTDRQPRASRPDPRLVSSGRGDALSGLR